MGLEAEEDARRQPARPHPRPRRALDPAVRAPRHGRRQRRPDRPGDRRRRLGERQRRHPRRRQQGRGGGDARARAALQRRGLAGRDRAAVHGLRGERARRRQGVRRRAAAVGLRLRLRPRDADRRGRHRVADLLPHRRGLPRPRRPRRHPPRGRPLRDPRRRPRDRRDAARPHRRADDRQRRLDPGRRGLHQRRAGALPPARRDALARPERVEEVVAGMVDAIHDGAAHAECDVDVISERLFVGYRTKPARSPWSAAEAALRALRLRAAADRHRRRVGRQRARGRGLPVREPRQRDRAQPRADRARRASPRSSGMLDVAFALLDEAAVV